MGEFYKMLIKIYFFFKIWIFLGKIIWVMSLLDEKGNFGNSTENMKMYDM